MNEWKSTNYLRDEQHQHEEGVTLAEMIEVLVWMKRRRTPDL